MCLKRARSEGSSVSRLDEPDTGADVSPSSHASDPMACAVGNRGHLRWRCCAPQTEPARGCGAARLAPTTQGAKRRTFGAAHRKRKAKRRRGSAPNRRPLLRALPGDEAAGGGIASESTFGLPACSNALPCRPSCLHPSLRSLSHSLHLEARRPGQALRPPGARCAPSPPVRLTRPPLAAAQEPRVPRQWPSGSSGRPSGLAI